MAIKSSGGGGLWVWVWAFWVRGGCVGDCACVGGRGWPGGASSACRAMLCHAMLCRALCCAVLCCAALCCAALCCMPVFDCVREEQLRSLSLTYLTWAASLLPPARRFSCSRSSHQCASASVEASVGFKMWSARFSDCFVSYMRPDLWLLVLESMHRL